MVIVVVGLGSVAMDAKSNPLVSSLSGSSTPDSTPGSSWPLNLSITAIWTNGSNFMDSGLSLLKFIFLIK